MEIKEEKQFKFTIKIKDGSTFNFTIVANSELMAKQQLSNKLEEVIAQLLAPIA